MEEKFIAYFDFLGFKEFINNTSIEYQNNVMSSIFTEIEMSITNGKTIIEDGFAKAKLTEAKVNCINFSDTIIFWTNKSNIEDLEELLKVSHRFNAFCNIYTFPVRGAIVKGEINPRNYNTQKESVYSYNVNSLFGKGLIKSYDKAEQQDWAGTVIDFSIIEYLIKNTIEVNPFLIPFAKEYNVPYKNSKYLSSKEWVMNLVEKNQLINNESFNNIKNNIVHNFAKHNKKCEDKSVRQKVKNTIDFLKTYKII